jgi:hypothetical protein
MNKLINGFVALPDGIKAGITAVVLWVVSVVFANLIALVPFLAFLAQFVQPVSLAIAAALIAALEKALPDAYPQIAITALQLILLVLAAFGVGVELSAQGTLPALLSF